jgi:small GTP-binding protein
MLFSKSSSISENNDINLKILILGDSSVGKTSLLLQYADGYFPTVYVATIGVEYKIKPININGTNLNLQIWDTAGQERFRSITQNFMKGADGIIYVYDITNKQSFDNLRTWIRQSEETTEGFKKIIVGNKSDLEAERIVQKESLKKFCDDRHLTGLEASAKSGTNVKEIFENLTKMIVGDRTQDELIKTYTEGARERGLSIQNKKKKKDKKKCCSTNS